MEKLDEGSTIIAQMSVEFEVDRLMKEYEFTITDEEVDYYVENFNIQPLHQQLILSHFASVLGSFRNTYEVSRRDLIRLALLLKKRMLRDAGYDDPTVFTEAVYFPYIITGNIKEHVNTRLIKNSNFKESCLSSYIISDLLTHQYRYLEEIDPDRIMGILSTINNTTFTYCCYERQDKLGEDVVADRANITDELGFFLRSLSS